jgi:hypothetical protein
MLAVDENLGLVAGHGLLTRKVRPQGGRPEKKEGIVGSRSISPAASRTTRFLGACVFTPLLQAAASRPERGERLHRGGYFIRRAGCQGVRCLVAAS